MKTRLIHDIADEIRRDWPRPYFGAVPYLEAMRCLAFMSDKIDHDDARQVVAYFLGNATRWKGETARRVKAELNAMLARR